MAAISRSCRKITGKPEPEKLGEPGNRLNEPRSPPPENARPAAGKIPIKKPPAPQQSGRRRQSPRYHPHSRETPGTHGRITASGRPRLLKEPCSARTLAGELRLSVPRKDSQPAAFSLFSELWELTLPVSASDPIGYPQFYHSRAFFSSFFSV